MDRDMAYEARREKIMVSAATSYSFAAAKQEQQPRTPRKLKIRVKLPPLAACGVVKKPDGTCTVRPIRGSGKQMKLVRAAFLNCNLGLSETSSSSVSRETKPAACFPDKIDVGDDRCTGFLEVKQSVTKPSSAATLESKTEVNKRKLNQNQQCQSNDDRKKRVKVSIPPEEPEKLCRRPVTKPTNPVGGDRRCNGFLEAKQQEAKPSSATAFERKLEETKNKLQQQYRSIEDRRKRKKIEVINYIPASLPKDPKNTCRWR